jgi:hypothetical protein
MEGDIKLEEYEDLITKHLPNIKELTLIVSNKAKVQLEFLIRIGLLQKIPIRSFRIVCKT